ncbi:MAG: DUF1232 domain-containing protein [Holophagales bacterium]|nr:MAG: DUF1232 domain-containing protein [Holophagales bacterium]
MTEPRQDVHLQPQRLLSFYDRLRVRMVRYVARRSKRLGPAAVEALLLVPDIFILLVRLALDPKVPGGARALIGGALLYFVSPVDLFPEAILGPVGFLEDLVLASAVLSQALGGELEPYARRYWSGEQELREVLHDIAHSASSLLGGRLHRRLERALARRGVELPPAEPARRLRPAGRSSRARRGGAGEPAGPIVEEAWTEPPVDPELRGGFESPHRDR